MIVAAKINYSESGVISTLGVVSGDYRESAAGLLRNTWYPILNPDVSVSVSCALPWDGGSPSQSVGDIELTNGADGIDDHLLDKLLTAVVAGQDVEVRRGEASTAFDSMELLFKSTTDRVRFDGESVILSQRSSLSDLSKPINTLVFDEDTPNPRIVNQTVPNLLGEAFQIAPLIWDAANQVYYTAKNLSKIRGVNEGGAETDNWIPVQFGHQMTAGTSLKITVDAVGPPPDTASETNLLTWTFDAWTSDDPDDATTFETTGEATISESSGGGSAEIEITGSPASDTGFVSFTSPELFAPWGLAAAEDWTASSGTLADSIIVDDGTYAEFSSRQGRWLFVTGLDPALPDNSIVTGVELEVIALGTSASLFDATVIDQNGFQLADFVGQTGGGDFDGSTLPASKTTLTGGNSTFLTTPTEFTTERVNPGIGIALRVEPTAGQLGNARIYQVRIKLHYTTAVATVRLYSTTSVMTAGKRAKITIDASAADIFARWASVAASGDSISSSQALSDPFGIYSATLDGSGVYSFEFVPDVTGFFAIEFFKKTSAGTATIENIKVDELTDGKNTYSELVPYIAETLGLTDAVDTTSIEAHDTACGNPPIGWYLAANESGEEILDLFAASLSGAWWPDRDGKVRSVLWSDPSTETADYTITNVLVDGKRQRTHVVGNITVETDPATGSTERAVGARNWSPIRPENAAGITEEFDEQARANVLEEWRVIRRADFDDLNPWPVA